MFGYKKLHTQMLVFSQKYLPIVMILNNMAELAKSNEKHFSPSGVFKRGMIGFQSFAGTLGAILTGPGVNKIGVPDFYVNFPP